MYGDGSDGGAYGDGSDGGAYGVSLYPACPYGWPPAVSADGTAGCVSPDGYSGPCPGFGSFAGYSDDDKTSWAVNCQASWFAPPATAPQPQGALPTQPILLPTQPLLPCPAGWTPSGDTCRLSAGAGAVVVSPMPLYSVGGTQVVPWATSCPDGMYLNAGQCWPEAYIT